ncbi:U3 small nucleolar RNA-interacting protein [Entamoeba marina]
MSDPFLVPFKRRLEKAEPNLQKRVNHIRTEFTYSRKKEDVDRKRIELAQQHIDDIKQDQKKSKEPKQAVYETLFSEAKDKTKEQALLADDLHFNKEITTKTTRKMNKPCSSVVINKNDQTKVYVSSLDGKIFEYDILTNSYSNQFIVPNKTKSSIRPSILSLCTSYDNKYLVASTSNKQLLVYDPISRNLIAQLRGHQDNVNSCVFREGTYEMYSCSSDRSVKVWNVETHSLMDTLYGHHSPINSIDALTKERCVTASTDKTVRVWKVAEETQLVYNSKQEMECVSLVNEGSFISGGFDGTLSFYVVSKKTPKLVVKKAHQSTTSISTIKYSDAVFTGGVEGFFSRGQWDDKTSLNCNDEINVGGCVNSIDIMKDKSAIVCAVGNRYRLGDWIQTKGVNGISVVKLN